MARSGRRRRREGYLTNTLKPLLKKCGAHDDLHKVGARVCVRDAATDRGFLLINRRGAKSVEAGRDGAIEGLLLSRRPEMPKNRAAC